jgi:hypothetical protein
MPAKDLKDSQSKTHDHRPEPAKPVVQAPENIPEKEKSPAESLRLRSRDPNRMSQTDILALQESVGNRAVSRLLDPTNSAPPIQYKLTVGAADDAYEQEADRTAEQVMRMPDPAAQREAAPEEEEEPVQTAPLQREAAPEEEEELVQTAPLQREAAPEEEEELVQTARVQGDPGASFEVQPGVEDQIQNQRDGGAPLPGEVRDFMEPRFGADFSGVRLHSGSEAANLNREVSAQAFTTGHDIFLGGGVSDLGSDAGKRLLAHELTHTIQQGAAPAKTAQRHDAAAPEQDLAQRKLLTTKANKSLQRHPQGEELPDKEAQVAEVSEKEQIEPERSGPEETNETGPEAPEATRTAEEEKTEVEAGKAAGKAFTESQKLTPGAMSLASAEKILQGSYGGLKKIVPGSVEILADQAACSAKYDEVCIRDGVKNNGQPWKAGDRAKMDAAKHVLTQGFAWKGVVYVNGKTTLVTATAHEILHNNTEPKFRAAVGETFNEGVTETLARQALTDAGITVPAKTAYPTQVALTKLLIDLVGIDVVKNAYFTDVQGLLDAYKLKAGSTWAALKQAAEALDTEKVKEALKPAVKT